MAWAGTGLVWSFAGGVPVSRVFGESRPASKQTDFSFVQISDSHIGFNKSANTDVTATLGAALDKINGYSGVTDFLVIASLPIRRSRPSSTHWNKSLAGAKRQVFYVPGEHDTSVDDGELYVERYGKGSKGNGWYSFDHKGVHFVGLVNVVQLEGMGRLGQPQLDWIKQDLSGLKSSTPIVVFAHIPLWAVYPTWGWSTATGSRPLPCCGGSAR